MNANEHAGQSSPDSPAPITTATTTAPQPADGEPTPAPPPDIRLGKILVPVDFSAPSRKALDYALAFAQQFGARLVLAHVVELTYVGTGLGEIEVPPLDVELRQNAARQLGNLVKEAHVDRFPYDSVLREGRPWHEIVQLARSVEADLIIMGTHGYTGLKHVVMGSTAERVVQHAPCPVLVVRELEHEFVHTPDRPACQSSK